MISQPAGCLRWWVLWMVVLAAGAGSWAADAPRGRELIEDPRFERGFRLIEPTPGRRVVYGTLAGVSPAGGAPAWDLDQWSSLEPLKAVPGVRLAEGGIVYSNAAKSVTLGRARTAAADLALRVNAGVEYPAHARRASEPWVHLLAEQAIQGAPPLSTLSRALLHVEGRLLLSHKIATPDYSPGLHAAQFQIFLSVQNLNRASAGFGRYLWFGIPLYDDRSRFPKAHKTQDTGGTGMFIFTPAGESYTSRSAHDREWITVHDDLLPRIREGLETAWRAGFLTESKALEDYRIASINLGWEVPGLFDVEFQVRNLSLTIDGASATQSPAPR